MSGGLGNIMKQAQAMQAQLQKAQQELAESEVVGSAGGGVVTVTMNGRHDVRRVHIDPSLRDDEVEVLEDLVAAAVNDAVQKVAQLSQEKMGKLGAGISIPDMNLPL